VFEEREMKGREEVGGGCRKWRNEELHNLHTSPNIIKTTKLGRMKLVMHTAHVGDIYKMFVGKLKQRYRLKT
jgi:hypothetical protein